MIWDNLREEEFEDAIKKSGGLCVIPIGCMEKHGQHLPVGADYIQALAIAKAAAEIEDVVIFPVGAWLGEVSCFHAFKNPKEVKLRGCIGIKQTTLLTILEELCDEIARNGFTKILFVNNHGGNNPLLQLFLRAQSYEFKPYSTMTVFASSGLSADRVYSLVTQDRKRFPAITDKDVEVLKRLTETGYGGGHADMRETGIVMAVDESLVAPERYDAESGLSSHRTDYLSDVGVSSVNAWLANYPNSYNAYPPHDCSRAIGEAYIKIASERLAKAFKLLKEDEDCIKSCQMLPKE